MKKFIILVVLVVASTAGFTQGCGPWNFPSFSAKDTVLAKDYKGEKFALSQNYPAKAPGTKGPWERIDFTKEPEKFMDAVLAYCWEGNEDAKWVAQNNKIHKWYHTPWLHTGNTGREFIHGLVMQRASKAKELHPDQADPAKNYAISFFNEPGGYTIGQVWCNPEQPDAKKAIFPSGTVAFQLVFTTASDSTVPYLKGAMQWDAFIDPNFAAVEKRSVQKVQLIEVDIMVKTDNPAAANGWVYLSFVFDGTQGGKTAFENLTPIGISWGNDPKTTAAEITARTKTLKETWINPSMIDTMNRSNSFLTHFGWGDRLAGVIDNANTSCNSCHGAAGYPLAVDVVAPAGIKEDSILHWFRNLKSGEPFYQNQTPLDNSMELAAGIRNFMDAKGGNATEPVFRGSKLDLLNLFTPLKGAEKEKPMEPGIYGRRTGVFVVFIILIIGLAALLVMNLIRKPS